MGSNTHHNAPPLDNAQNNANDNGSIWESFCALFTYEDKEYSQSDIESVYMWMAFWLVGAVVIIACVTESFWYIDYKNYALKINSYHGVTSHRTYGEGREFITLDNKMIMFPSTYQLVEFTSSTFADDGLEFDLDITFYYNLPKDAVGDIYDKFSTNYHSRVENNAKQVTKNIASTFDVNTFLENRTFIEDSIAQALEPYLLSTVGVNAPVPYVKIVDMRFPSLLIETSLITALSYQTNEIQIYQQEVDLIIADTAQMKASIDAQTLQTIEFATNEASEIVAKSDAEAIQILLITKSDGIENVCNVLNITTPVDKNKLTRVFAVMDNVHTTTTMLDGVGSSVLVQA